MFFKVILGRVNIRFTLIQIYLIRNNISQYTGTLVLGLIPTSSREYREIFAEIESIWQTTLRINTQRFSRDDRFWSINETLKLWVNLIRTKIETQESKDHKGNVTKYDVHTWSGLIFNSDFIKPFVNAILFNPHFTWVNPD